MQTKDIKDLNPAALAALAKMIGDGAKANRENLKPGTYVLDGEVVTLVLDGTVKVSADSERAPTCSIPLLAALALFAKRMGIQREATLTLLREVMTEALDLGTDATAELLQETGVKEVMDLIQEEVISKLPPTPTKGQVKVKGTIGVPALSK